MENKILFDWLSFTCKTKRVDINGVLIEKIDERNLVELLGLVDVPWEELPGVKGFKNRMYFDGISIHYNSDVYDYMWVEMSGQGCRVFESLSTHKSYSYMFKFFLSNSDIATITRLDVAYDDFIGLLDIYAIADDVVPDIKDTSRYNFVSPCRSHSVTVSDRGVCVNIGSSRSEIMFRIYDKAAERNKKDSISHWVRCEIQLRRCRAYEFIRLLEEENETVDQGNWVVHQEIVGGAPLFTALNLQEDALLHIASIYAEEELTEVDELAKDAVSEFLNLHNGIYLVNMSNCGTELTMKPQQIIKASTISGELLAVTVKTSKGSFQLLLSSTPSTVSLQ